MINKSGYKTTGATSASQLQPEEIFCMRNKKTCFLVKLNQAMSNGYTQEDIFDHQNVMRYRKWENEEGGGQRLYQ